MANLFTLILKIIRLSDVPASSKNDDNKSASSRNDNSRPASRKNDGNGEINKFGGNSVKYAKKSGKLKDQKSVKSQ